MAQYDLDVWVERTPWSERLLFNTWRAPFPYLFHPWQVMCLQGYCASGRARAICKWMAEWHELEMKDEPARS